MSQDVKTNSAQLLAFVPAHTVREHVRTFLLSEHKEAELHIIEESDTHPPDPSHTLRRIVHETLEPKLIEQLGQFGRHLAKIIARIADRYATMYAWKYDRSGGDHRYLQREIEAETEFAIRELVRVWHDTLVIMSGEAPEGCIILDALLYPKTDGVTEPLAGFVPGTFALAFPVCYTWRPATSS